MFSLKHRELLDDGSQLEFNQLFKRLKEFLLLEHNEDGSHRPEGVLFPVGTMVMFGGTEAPTGWLFCDGTAVSRATYKTLLDAIGVVYGIGDGSTTFNIPDMRQRFPLGKAPSGTGATLGATGGTIDLTVTGPSHTHTISIQSTAVQSGSGTNINNPTSATTSASGTGASGTANPPFTVVNYLIYTGAQA